MVFLFAGKDSFGKMKDKSILFFFLPKGIMTNRQGAQSPSAALHMDHGFIF
jgi:hypothetical protein